MMRQPEAGEHGYIARESDGDKCEAFCLQRLETDGSYRSYLTGAKPHRLTTVWYPQRLAIAPFSSSRHRSYDCVCRSGEDSKGIGRKYTA